MKMNTDDVKQRMRNIEEQIARYDHAYYVLNKPMVPDAHYDAVIKKLEKLEEKYPELANPHSPVKRVGSDLSNEFRKEDHKYPVLSVRNVPIQKIEALLPMGNLVAETKYDGVCISVEYDNGQLVRALSRGDGFKGNVITENVLTIRNIPLTVSRKENFVVKGEVICPLSEFKKLNKQLDTPYASPQAAAAAIIRHKRSNAAAMVKLQFIAHGIAGGPFQNMNYTDQIALLNSLLFQVPNSELITDPSAIQPAINRLMSFQPADGVVFKINDLTSRQYYPNNTRYFGWMFAWKPEYTSAAKCIGINWTVAKTGRLTPVACLQAPLKIAGNTISAVSLGSANFVQENKISTGSTLHINIVGTVPSVTYASNNKPDAELPEQCPECGVPLATHGKHLFCTNAECPAVTGIPAGKKYLHEFLVTTFGNWKHHHLSIVSRRFGAKLLKRSSSGSSATIQYNTLSQLADIAYTMSSEKLQI